MRHVLAIAVEHYQDPKISRVRHAENDAKGISAAIALHHADASITTLVNERATKTRIESAVRTASKAASEDDSLVLFYAGHGFADPSSNFITCHDTVRHDLVKTSIALPTILRELRASKCKRVMLLIDSCHSGLGIDDSMRSLLTDMTDEDFVQFCKESQHHIAFASCATDEESYSSNGLGHGIWSYHVIKALRGEDKSALERGKFLTSSSLQNYLSAEVPRTVRKEIAGPYPQHPRSWGTQSREFIIADLSAFLEREAATASRGLRELNNLAFVGQTSGSIKRLSGWVRNFRIPEQANEATRNFVLSVGKQEVYELAEELFESLKATFRYKRKDIQFSNDTGAASIITPSFTVNVTLDIDVDDASQYVLSTQVTEINDAAAVQSEEFAQVFDGRLDRIVLTTAREIKVRDIIDKIEDLDDDNFRVSHSMDEEQCSVTVSDSAAVLEFSGHEVILRMPRRSTVAALLSAFNDLPAIADKTKITQLLPRST